MTDNARILAAYDGLRLADVRDGLDVLGFHHQASMEPAIRPLWRTRAIGIARTVRYLPFQGPTPAVPPDEYWSWSGTYYGTVCPYPWMQQIELGDFIVLDCSGVDAGLMGSENTLAVLRQGGVGLVTNGGVRDTDEVILQKVPVWSAMVSKAMVQLRLQFESTQQPVAVGGVAVFPGDVVVADGDGVVVVPRRVALEVAAEAHAEHSRDRANRRRHYEALGLSLDDTV